MLYSGNNEVRRVRMNQPHPSPLKPSWYGDSVGHYEGDTLVIDTVGVKTDRKYAMIDLFGTPYTDKLHVVERYRMRDYDDVKDAIDRNNKENWLFQGDVWTPQRDKKFLQVARDDRGCRRLHDALDRNPDLCTGGRSRRRKASAPKTGCEYYHGENSKECGRPESATSRISEAGRPQ